MKFALNFAFKPITPDISIGRENIDTTEITLRMGFGWLEPHSLTWYERVEAVRLLVICWCILGFSFNAFFNIDFRVSLLSQTFPPDIDDADQVDLARNGIFFDIAHQSE